MEKLIALKEKMKQIVQEFCISVINQLSFNALMVFVYLYQLYVTINQIVLKKKMKMQHFVVLMSVYSIMVDVLKNALIYQSDTDVIAI
jgi:hypothetical protein